MAEVVAKSGVSKEKGYLQNKNLDFFNQLNSNSHQVLSTLMGISDIQTLVVKKARKYF